MSAAQVFPTKGNLIAVKKSLELAKMGYELMDRKHNLLVHEMMSLIDRANTLRSRIDETFDRAYAALQRANITLGIGAGASLAQSVPEEKSLELSFRSVMGVEIPSVKISEEPVRPCYAFFSTNSAFDEAFVRFHEVKMLTAELAEVENSAYRLAVAIKKTQSRANALKNIIIPDQEATIRFITNALEEKEREEFSRLKVIKKSSEQKAAGQ